MYSKAKFNSLHASEFVRFRTVAKCTNPPKHARCMRWARDPAAVCHANVFFSQLRSVRCISHCAPVLGGTAGTVSSRFVQDLVDSVCAFLGSCQALGSDNVCHANITPTC